MTCSACSNSIEKHLNSLKGVKSAQVSLVTHQALVEFDSSLIRAHQIKEEIEDIGFEADYHCKTDSVDVTKLLNETMMIYRNKLIKCGLLYLPIALLIWILPSFAGFHEFMISSGGLINGISPYVVLIFLLATYIQFVHGRPFYSGAYKSLKHGSANMDVLIVISTSSAWFYAFILMLKGYPQINHHNPVAVAWLASKIHDNVHYWETSSVLIFIVLVGKFIESFSKTKTISQLQHLASLKVTRANLITNTSRVTLASKHIEVPVETLKVDDYVMVLPGDAVPIDGQVFLGKGCCNEAMLTGEARPVVKELGHQVFGGSILT